MLKKLTELEISADSPFTNDALNRGGGIEKLTNLIKSTEQPFVLSVEAPWGYGKTTFIRMWKAHLEKSGHVCLHFNAWENDFVDDPLVAFLGEMKKLVEKETKELAEDQPITKHWAEVKRIGAGVLRKTLPLAIQVATQGLLTQEAVKQAAGAVSEKADKIGEFASTLAKERLEKYEAERNGIKGFRTNLEKLAHEFATKSGSASPLVFFIDEMDRCRPDFAIALLERIKHLFNVPRVVFVLAIDRAQLNESVKALYGLEANPDGYLRRFIDLAYTLPSPTTERFVENLFTRFAMDECFRERNDGQELARIWRKAFATYAQALSLSLRAQEQCCTEMNIVLRTASRQNDIYPAVLAFFSAVRAYRPGIILELKQKRISIDKVLDWFAGIEDSWLLLWVEAALVHSFCDEDELRSRLAKIKARFVKQGARAFDDWTSRLAEHVGREGLSWRMQFILSELEMTTEFR